MDRRSFSQLVGSVRAMMTATTRLATPMIDEQEWHAEAKLLQQAEHQRADNHEGGVEHIDGGDDAGAAIGTRPGLHGGECRHDEQAAGDREAGEIDGDVDRARRREIVPEVDRACRMRKRRRGPAEIEREQAEQYAADQRRQQHDAPVREPRGKARSDRNRDRKNGEEERDDARGAADLVGRPAAAAARGRRRRSARTSSPPSRPTTAAARRGCI